MKRVYSEGEYNKCYIWSLDFIIISVEKTKLIILKIVNPNFCFKVCSGTVRPTKRNRWLWQKHHKEKSSLIIKIIVISNSNSGFLESISAANSHHLNSQN